MQPPSSLTVCHFVAAPEVNCLIFKVGATADMRATKMSHRANGER
jgi:hypothetical protein